MLLGVEVTLAIVIILVRIAAIWWLETVVLVLLPSRCMILTLSCITSRVAGHSVASMICLLTILVALVVHLILVLTVIYMVVATTI